MIDRQAVLCPTILLPPTIWSIVSGMALSEQELMTAAKMVRKQHGFRAPSWICGRIADLEKAGDTAGADTWTKILCCLGEIESIHVGTLQ